MAKGSKLHLPLFPFYRLPKLARNGAKMRNTPQNLNFYIHEDQTLTDLLNIAIDKINKTNILCFEISNRSSALCPENFDIHYSINHTDSMMNSIINSPLVVRTMILSQVMMRSIQIIARRRYVISKISEGLCKCNVVMM